MGHEATALNFDVWLDVGWNFFGLDLDLDATVGADNVKFNVVIAIYCVNVGRSVSNSFDLAVGATKVNTVGENIHKNLHPFKGL